MCCRHSASSVVQVEPGSPAFARVQEALERKLRNAYLQPAQHAAALRLRCLTHSWPLEQRLAAVQRATPAALQVRPAAVELHPPAGG